MSRRVDDDSLDEGQDFDDEPALVECPHCGEEIVEFAEFCPRCKRYVSREDAPRGRPPVTRVIVVVLLIATFSGAAAILFGML